MQDIMIRIETDDFEAWKTQHYLHAQNRSSYGITDDPRIRIWTTLTLPCSTSRPTTWIGPWNGSRVTLSKRHHDWPRSPAEPSTLPNRRPDKARAVPCCADSEIR